MALKRVLIMGGGTGGHVFPGLAVACYLREQGIEVHWLGTQQGMEARLVPEFAFPLHFITISGLRGKGLKSLFLAPFRISLAVFQSLRIMRKINPDVIIGMGGFVSGPGGIASWLLRQPLVIHEQNAKAGLTNRWLGRIAVRILEGFPHVWSAANKHVIATGNPVRAEITQLLPPGERLREHQPPFRLLVLGGSLGAQAINDVVPRALAQLLPEERPAIYHQTGEKHLQKTQQAYAAAGVAANIVPFIKEMDQAYGWADIVLCRAGALTVAELCAVGLGAIFVPFPYAADDHQTANAVYMVKNSAALLIAQSELTAQRLANLLKEFASLPEKRLAMAQAAYKLRHVDVAEKIYHVCEEVCP